MTLQQEIIVYVSVILVIGVCLQPVRRWRAKRVIAKQMQRAKQNLRHAGSFEVSGTLNRENRRWRIPGIKGRGYYHTNR